MTITPYDVAKIQHAELVALLELLAENPDAGMKALGTYGHSLATRHQPREQDATGLDLGLWGPMPAVCSHGGTVLAVADWPCPEFTGLSELLARLAEIHARKLCQAFTWLVLGDPDAGPQRTVLATCYLETHGPETRHRAEVTHNGTTVDFEWPNRVEPEPKPYRSSFTWGGVWAEAQQWMEQLPTKVMGFSTSVVDGPPPLRLERSGVMRDRLHVCTHDKGCRLLDWGQAVTWDGRGFTVSGGAPSGVQHR